MLRCNSTLSPLSFFFLQETLVVGNDDSPSIALAVYHMRGGGVM